MEKVKAIFLYNKHADKILNKMKIPYQTWSDENYNVEWRVDIENLSEENIKDFKEIFNINVSDENYTIFFN